VNPKKRPEYLPGYTYDQSAVDNVIDFLQEVVTMSEGEFAGKKMQVLPWQREFIEAVYGWKGPDGKRRCRKAGLFIAKKNGKSSLLAGLALHSLIASGEQGGLVAIGACDRKMAGIIYRMVASTIRASPLLTRHLKIIESRYSITHPKSNSRLVALGADAFRADGLSCSMVLLDELHRHRKPDLAQTLLYSGAARREPLCIGISTAGAEREGLGWEWFSDIQRHQADPKDNPSFIGRIYAADEKDDIDDPATWEKANPSLGATISPESFRIDLEDAKANPTRLANFLRLRLNIWCEQDLRWFPATKVAENQVGLTAPIDGRTCVCGLDLASVGDITAASFVFPVEDGGFDIHPLFWIPEETIAEKDREGLPYSQWVNDGWLRTTQGGRTDFEQVARDILEVAAQCNVVNVITDPWNAGPIATPLQAGGLEVLSLPQTTARLNAPSKMLEAAVIEGNARFENPVLGWMMRNVSIFTDTTESIKPAKGRSRAGKIDGVVATVNALAEIDKAVASSDYRIFVL
jgi:phage terminase large subunit-like protein